MADPPGSKFAMLQELQRRQQAILAGMQGEAQYPDVGAPQYDHDGIVEMSDAPPANVGDFSQAKTSPEKARMMAELDQIGRGPDFSSATTNRYQYKPEFKNAPGAGPGTYEGPMSDDLKSIPGVVEPGPDGMDRVNHGRLSMANASATGENAREIEQLRKRLAALEGGLSSSDDILKEAQSGKY